MNPGADLTRFEWRGQHLSRISSRGSIRGVSTPRRRNGILDRVTRVALTRDDAPLAEPLVVLVPTGSELHDAVLLARRRRSAVSWSATWEGDYAWLTTIE